MEVKRESSPIPSGDLKRVKYIEENGNKIENLRKRRFSRYKNMERIIISQERKKIDLTSIPIEILFEILSYLDCRDLYALRGVSKFFERLVLEPSVWTAYEVRNNGLGTSEVIEELKRMPHLRKISIDERMDCDDILRQLSCSNKKLQRLSISNCTGSTANLYLRPVHLIRILQRCSKLHTITINGSRFRGLKFYRLLGEIGHRLKFVSLSTTCMQFRTFAKHVTNSNDNDRMALITMCPGSCRWGPLRYYTIEKSDRSKTALVSYYYHDFLYVDLNPVRGIIKLRGSVILHCRRLLRDISTQRSIALSQQIIHVNNNNTLEREAQDILPTHQLP